MALRGLKVIEMAGLAPAPFAGMILSDFGASVIRIDKPGQPPFDTLARNKRSVCISLKKPQGVEVVKDLCCKADILLEPYRSGVMEKLGLGPDLLCSLNPKLIYARLTGFGQSGPLSRKAGHDINYLAISGVLSMLGREDSNPHPPINLLADFAGGGLMCVMGILMALFERSKSGKGQIIDVAMSSGVSYLSTFLTTSKKMGLWTGPTGTNMLDGGAPFYDTYKTSDGGYMSVGAIEPQFYSNLLHGLGIDKSTIPDQMDIDSWPEVKSRLSQVFSTKSRKEWTDIFSNIDACVEPVLSMNESVTHPHNIQRGMHSFDEDSNQYIPTPEPHLSRSPGEIYSFSQPDIGQHTKEVLKEMEYSNKKISELVESGVVYQNDTQSKL